MVVSDEENYWERTLEKNYNLTGTGCLSLGKNYNKWLYKIKLKSFLRIIKNLNQDIKNKDVLDVGSGTGFYIEAWNNLGAKAIVGTDITHAATKNLKKKFPTNEFFQFDIGNEQIIPQLKQYDIISALDVLFHIVDDARYERAIKNIYNLLRPDGIFIFSENFLEKKTIRTQYHISRTAKHTEQILNSIGFKIIYRFPQTILMNYPSRESGILFKSFWHVIGSLIRKNEIFGSIIGLILYPFELISIRFSKNGPSSKIIACKKINQIINTNLKL